MMACCAPQTTALIARKRATLTCSLCKKSGVSARETALRWYWVGEWYTMQDFISLWQRRSAMWCLRDLRIRTLLDIGCGEGFYGGVLSSRLPHLTCYGIDVAKPAVKLAAKTYPHQHYAVASSRDLPVITSSIDMALCVFSPSNDAEISRVLRPGGFYLEVGPGPEHLWQLKSALYEQPRQHKPSRRQMMDATLADEGEVRFDSRLDNGLLQALLAATPFAFRGRRESRAALKAQSDFLVTFAFSWRLFVLGEKGAR